MSDIGKKIIELRGPGVSQRQLALRAGIEQGTLSRIERGEMQLVSPHLQRIAQALNVPESVLLATEDRIVHPAEIGSRRLPVWDYTTAASFVYSSPQKFKKDGQQFVLTDRDYPAGTFALHVTDRSMEPLISQGMVVIIDRTREVRPDCLVAVEYEDAGSRIIATRHYHDRGQSSDGMSRFEALPANRAYRTLTSEDPFVKVVGVVVEDRRYYS